MKQHQFYNYAVVDGYNLIYRIYKSESIHDQDELKEAVLKKIDLLKERAEKIVMVFDAGPYFSNKINSEYKSRISPMKKELEEEKAPSSDKEKISNKSGIQVSAFRVVKKFFMKEYKNDRVISFFHRGYEADNIAYMMSCIASSKGKTMLLCSKDSDWKYYVNKGVDFYSASYEKVRSYIESRVAMNVTPYQYKAIYDSIYGGHNSLVKLRDEDYLRDNKIEIDLDDDFARYSNNEVFLKNLKIFLIDQYPEFDKLKNEINSIII